MNLLLQECPQKIIEVNGTLYFDTDTLSDEDNEFEGECITYDIITDYKSIIDIMIMYEKANLTDQEKNYLMLQMFYCGNVPNDTQQAFEKAIEFLNVVTTSAENNPNKEDYGRLFSFEQESYYIFFAINYSHNDILKTNSDLHWWDFYSKFMQLKEDCEFIDIVNNRLAHKMGKATKEQQKARKEYPEKYILGEQRKIDDKQFQRAKEMQDKLNNE